MSSIEEGSEMIFPHALNSLGSYFSRPQGSVRCMESAVKDLESRCFTSQTKASHMVKVHHYLNTNSLGKQHAHVQCDNCCGQNKNNIVIWYLLWRVLVYTKSLSGRSRN
ncbi:uncharacterized protein LOC127877603 isoform X2 [Dreissena polymorpha]|uniref:uncharacterized protein LOC127877603 isoform X2 n=1 Tax=Dreissena polymorpha TaxID=45954 RepID=UPI002264E527|nr:uncharacterized protein LOC127877603 isoform X2 [Dreissena polymorpha]